MNALKFLLLLGFVDVSFLANTQQTPTMLDTARISYNQISQEMGMFVYPSKGQSKSQQKKDEFECYNWAVEQSGVDPLNLPKIEAPTPHTGSTGGGVVGAAKGAAAGAALEPSPEMLGMALRSEQL